MLYDRILVRYGDLTLKGKNRMSFVDRLYETTRTKCQGLNVKIEKTFDRIYIILNDTPFEEVSERLQMVAGIRSYSLVVKCDADLKVIQETALELLKEEIHTESSFKVESKRANKSFPYTSPEISKEVAGYVLPRMVGSLHVDVHNPDVTLHVEIKNESCYLYLSEVKGLGGFPTGIAGKGIVMMSGGIDSPVCGFLAMKQGVEIEILHFESTPLTSIESAQKVVDLTKKLAVYAPKNKIVVHMVPFKEIHQALLKYVPESYNITIMRRMMYRIATGVAEKRGALCIINGESVGQVASQTLDSMVAINSVTNIPVLRPLCTYDKEDIIRISHKIDTYDISIKPFEDCCTVYVPKAPATKPSIKKCVQYEAAFDYETMVKDAIENVNTIDISRDSDIDFSLLGLEVREVIKELKEGK